MAVQCSESEAEQAGLQYRAFILIVLWASLPRINAGHSNEGVTAGPKPFSNSCLALCDRQHLRLLKSSQTLMRLPTSLTFPYVVGSYGRAFVSCFSLAAGEAHHYGAVCNIEIRREGIVFPRVIYMH